MPPDRPPEPRPEPPLPMPEPHPEPLPPPPPPAPQPGLRQQAAEKAGLMEGGKWKGPWPSRVRHRGGAVGSASASFHLDRSAGPVLSLQLTWSVAA